MTIRSMEVLASAWFLLLICCTDWFGFQQCVAVPVPTLLNYYQGSPQSNWNFKYRQSRNPAAYYEKFTFPNKEPMPIFEDRSGKTRPNSGKIFFPDDVTDMKPDKSYQFTDSEDVRPIWKIRHRPTPSAPTSSSRWPSLNDMKDITSFVDGSNQGESSMQLSGLDEKIENADSQRSEILQQPVTHSEEQKEEEKVAAAIKQFYEWWVKRTKSSKQKTLDDPTPTNNGRNLISTTTRPEENTTVALISDQSLVAGLKDQNCPDGQVPLENGGECKVKVAV